MSGIQNYKGIMSVCWGRIAPPMRRQTDGGGGWAVALGAVPGNSCDCVEVTLGDRAGAGSGQPELPKLHYVGKMYSVARCRRSIPELEGALRDEKV